MSNLASFTQYLQYISNFKSPITYNTLNVVVRITFSLILPIWYVEVRIYRSISENPLEFEITRFNCIFACHIWWKCLIYAGKFAVDISKIVYFWVALIMKVEIHRRFYKCNYPYTCHLLQDLCQYLRWGISNMQSNLDSSNTDASFTMANSNTFLSPYGIIPTARENKYLGKFSSFFFQEIVCCVYSLESNSNEYTQHTFIVQKVEKTSLNYHRLLPDLAPWLTLTGSNYQCLE